MKGYIKNATRGVAFLFAVTKDLFQNHFIHKSIVKKTKSGKRFLAGAVALILIVATLLSDVSIAYAQTDQGVATVENNAATNETPVDAEAKEASEKPVTNVEVVESGTPVVETTENKESSDNKASTDVTDSEASKDETPTGEITNPETTNSENTTPEEPQEEDLNKEESVNTENSENIDANDAPAEMPAISVVKTIDDYEISLECIEGTFSEGTTVEIIKLEDEEKEEVDKLVEDAITEDDDIENDDIVKIVTFDVTFYDKDGNVVEPADENSVSIKIVPSEQDKEELENVEIPDDKELTCSVFHIEDDENVEEIECETDDPVEEITFEAESFSAYSIVWYKKDADGNTIEDPEKKGPEVIGGYVKSKHTFVDFDIPLEFTNEGNPADISFRPDELIFEIYGKDDATGGEGADHSEVLICEITVPIDHYDKKTKTVHIKEGGKLLADIPVYVVNGTQAVADGGLGNHVTEGFEYTVKLKSLGENSIYTIEKESTTVEVSSVFNQAEWSGKGKETLKAERQSLSAKKFYVSWVDNRNKAGKRPYSYVDDFDKEEKKTAFINSLTLYRQVEGGDVEEVTSERLSPITFEKVGPTAEKKDGKSISDWEITYNNLPEFSNGKPIKYFITIDTTADDKFENYSTVMPEGSGSVDVPGTEKKAFLSGETVKYIYSEKFTATVEWYDAENKNELRPSLDDLKQKIKITDEQDKVIYDGTKSVNVYDFTWTKYDGDEWKLSVGPLPMYSEQGGEKSYKLVLTQNVIPVKKEEESNWHHYDVNYSNTTKTTIHEYCLSDGKIIIVIDRDLDSFKFIKTWSDNHDYDRRREAVEAGVKFLLWRYPSNGTTADKAAVFDPITHTQYSYTLSMTDTNVTEVVDEKTRVKDTIEISLRQFGVTDENPVDAYDQNGHEYIYLATEVMSKSGYKLNTIMITLMVM